MGGADLSAGEDAERQDEEQEDEAEVADRGEDRAGAELRDLLLQALRDAGGGDALRDEAEDEGEDADAGEPGEQAAARRAQRLRGRRGKQVEVRRRGIAGAQEAAPEIPAGADHGRAEQERDAGEEREREHCRLGAAEGPQLLGPAERGQPAQPAGRPRGVGDRSQEQARGDDHAAELERDPARRCKLAGDRADAGEDAGDRGRREREVGRATHRQPRDDEPGELGAPEDEHAKADRDELRGEGGSPSERAGEHELEPARVLLGPVRTHRGEEPVDRGRDRERPTDAPGGVPADRGDVVRLAVEEAQPLVAGEAPREEEPARGRRVGPPIPERLDVGVDREQVGESERADLRVGEAAGRKGAGRAERAAAARRSGASARHRPAGPAFRPARRTPPPARASRRPCPRDSSRERSVAVPGVRRSAGTAKAAGQPAGRLAIRAR